MDKALILREIKKHYNFKTDGDFADFLGIKQNTLSNWSSRNSIDYDRIISKCEEIDGNWLLTGRGNMLRRPSHDPLMDRAEKALHKLQKEIHSVLNEPSETYGQKKLIPFYDGVVTAGTNDAAMLDSKSEPVEMIDAGDWFRDATAAMRVHGDSMYPEYKSGSIAALREVHNKRLVVYGQDYLIETTEYRVIKRLQKSDLAQNWLACSVNEEKYISSGRLIHEPFDVHIDDVLRLYQVLGNVKRNQSSTVIHASRPIKST